MPSSVTGANGRPWWPLLSIFAIMLLGGGVYVVWRSHAATPPPASTSAPKPSTITALGFLEPQGKVIKLSAPSSSGGASRVEQLLVKQGDTVKIGQVVAVLDSHDRLQAALQEAQQRVKVAQANLAVVKAGAKQGEVNAQQAEIIRLEAQRQGEVQVQTAAIGRLEAEVQNAQIEAQRYAMLYQQGATSAALRDSKTLALTTAQRSLQEAQAVLSRIQTTRSPELGSAQATLDRIAEVRPVDIAAAEAAVDQAIAAVQQAQAQLDLASVRAPQNGVVLDIHTRPGEVVSTDGIIELGRTSQMTALLEVYETDIGKIKIGQLAKLFADSRPEAFSGQVIEIGAKVKRQNVVNSDPSANIDARVVEVRVQLDAAQPVRGLTNLQVTGEIQQ
jgi:HlyD family secretion protein